MVRAPTRSCIRASRRILVDAVVRRLRAVFSQAQVHRFLHRLVEDRRPTQPPPPFGRHPDLTMAGPRAAMLDLASPRNPEALFRGFVSLHFGHGTTLTKKRSADPSANEKRPAGALSAPAWLIGDPYGSSVRRCRFYEKRRCAGRGFAGRNFWETSILSRITDCVADFLRRVPKASLAQIHAPADGPRPSSRATAKAWSRVWRTPRSC